MFQRLLCLAFLFLAIPVVRADEPNPGHWQFQVNFPKETRAEPFTGRVVLYFSRNRPEPRERLSWFNPEILVGRDVVNWKPGEPLVIDSRKPGEVVTCPKPLNQLDLSGWRVQAVARFNSWERKVGDGAGNGFSSTAVIPAASNQPSIIEMRINRLVPERTFPENDWCKLLRVRSSLLSDFHRREVFQQAAVLLPASYHRQPERRYPVIFSIPGFGGTHFEGLRPEPVNEQNAGSVEFIRVTLDPSCPLGHHVFADSANNGPFGTAFVQELIPELDRRFRTDARPQGRFLTGHSSGGWSSLWVMISHPNDFAGTWSTAPDPVDFRDWQQINLYLGDNMYADRTGSRRPIARREGQPVLWYRDFDLMEEALGPGGQLHSFEAVFSPRGNDGRPLRAWDRATGKVHADVVKAWEAYDIRLMLEQNWGKLGPQLKGKLHVFMGDLDTFYLDGATRLLRDSLKRIDSDAVVEMHPGRDHGSLLTGELLTRIRGEMVAAYLQAK